MASSRTRNFAFELYPESMSPDSFNQIEMWHIPSLVSPLHQFDTNPNGEVKKAHYHVVLMFDSVKTTDQVKELTKSIGGVGCLPINSIRGYVRYLCHLDNPEKYQYNPAEVKSFSGANYNDLVELETDRVKIIADMQEFCLAQNIYTLAELYTYSRIHNPDWFRALCTHCNNVMLHFLKSQLYYRDNYDKLSSYKSDEDYRAIDDY